MAGAAPSFSEVHVVRTLLLLNSGRIGRKNLVGILGVGEGSVRTIIKKLKRDGFIKSSKQGHELTEKGRERIHRYLHKFSIPIEFKSSDLAICPEKTLHSLIIIHNSAEKIGTGIEQRDIARDAGALSIALLLYKKGRPEFPTQEVKLSQFPESSKELENLNLKDKDVVVISFGKTKASAENGAVAVALELSRD